MKNHNGSPRLNHHHPAHHTRDRNGRRGDWLWAVWLRFSLRDYGFCMAALLLFSLGSLLYQLNGGPPRLLLDMRQYLVTASSPESPSRTRSVSPGLSALPRSAGADRNIAALTESVLSFS
ncbi:hypothetical protein AMELA_G00018070 [Ameiurus melas]|uniref:Uncharacterized protein n=1 Tax=Ameiurus melas TaxID=219545 RepID=A0A7J6BAY8_AMEME|nr:hypothetical protein AMELA_G00018070 [Ameiurus melas]